MNDETLETLIEENDQLLWTVKCYREQLKKAKEENRMLRQILINKGVKHE